MSHLGHRKPAHIHSLVRILVQRHNWATFFENEQGEAVIVNGDRYRAMLNEFLKIALSAAELMSLATSELRFEYYLWSAVKDKCYAVKPKTIDTLKNNIREAICEIQLHTIDNVLKNWTDRGEYCMTNRGSHLNEIIFHY